MQQQQIAFKVQNFKVINDKMTNEWHSLTLTEGQESDITGGTQELRYLRIKCKPFYGNLWWIKDEIY